MNSINNYCKGAKLKLKWMFILVLMTSSVFGGNGDLEISRAKYHEKLKGFWLGQCIANLTGITTEALIKEQPFLTDTDWGTNQGREDVKIEFVLLEEGDILRTSVKNRAVWKNHIRGVWGADDDTDIEYIYQELLLDNDTSILAPEQIRDGWLRHIKHEEPNDLWVSNEKALHLMMEGMLPPETSLSENNRMNDQIDAQLTTEIFGLFAPGRPDVALKMAHLPIRVAAYRDAEWISEFYVIMHLLAATVDPNLSMKDQTQWLAEQARKRLPNESFPAKMHDWIKTEYENNPDKDNWEKTRDRFSRRYQERTTDGYNYRTYFDAGINYGASLISLFYGEGDFKRTIQIGTLCGWDSDNPTATWGSLLGFMLGREGVERQFPDKKLSGLYNISRTRINFPDRTPDQPGDDSFVLMADRGIQIIDRVVTEEMGGRVDTEKGTWSIPCTGAKVQPAKY
jgi:hypothetical protein